MDKKIVHSLLLRNVRNEKHFSSSTFPRTWTMAIFASLRYLGKECVRAQDASIVLQSGFNGFKSKNVAPW